MSEFSHKQGMHWRQVFKKGEGEGDEIGHHLALKADPVIHDAPTIDDDELQFLRDLFARLG
jgi:hypothetical protein